MMVPAMPSGVVLRPMTPWDLPAVLELELLLFPLDAWPEEFYRDELAQAGPAGSLDARGRPATRDYRVLVHDGGPGDPRTGEILGYGGIMAVGDVADVQTVGTAPQAQGRGLGSAQLRWMAASAAERGAEALMLEARASNAPARRLYARHGFEQIHVRPGYYPGGEDAVVMRQTLAAASLVE